MEATQLKNTKINYIILFAVAQLLDLFSTYIGIGIFGFREMNPIMQDATFFEMALLKLFAILFVGFSLYFIKKFPIWFYRVMFIISVIPPFLNILQIVIAIAFF